MLIVLCMRCSTLINCLNVQSFFYNYNFFFFQAKLTLITIIRHIQQKTYRQERRLQKKNTTEKKNNSKKTKQKQNSIIMCKVTRFTPDCLCDNDNAFLMIIQLIISDNFSKFNLHNFSLNGVMKMLKRFFYYFIFVTII